MTKLFTREEYIAKAREIHGDTYDYSQLEYLGGKVKVTIICPKHGPFTIGPSQHTSARRGCPICGFGGTAEERFWVKVNKNGIKVKYVPDQCWEWKGYIAPNGYGRFKVTHSNLVLAHVYSYELAYGPIERDENGKRKLWVLHECDHRKCVNPSHLFLGTGQDNTYDAIIKGRLSSKMNPDKVRLARELYKTGKYSTAAVGEVFNVSASAIQRIVNRRTWKYVE